MTFCPVCNAEDAVRCKDDPRFYRDGRLWARCFHGNSHPKGGPVNFYVDTGELITAVELTPAESLYQIAQAGTARGFGGAFLAEKCGIYVITKEDVARSSSPIPTEKWMLDWEDQQAPVTIAPLYKGAGLAGLEVRAMVEKAKPRHGEYAPKSGDDRKTVGEAGVYITSTRLQPATVVVFAGVWDAISAAWDALQNGSEDRYVFASVPDGFNPAILRDTLETFFPGVPRLMVSDQDPSGQKTRKRFAKVCTMAILPGAGLAKDYREADPKKRWTALLDGMERALDAGNPTDRCEEGIWKIARRAFEGATEAKRQDMRDLEAWRFGQRCAGICKAISGGKKYYAIRARVYGRAPVPEGLHEFEPLLSHSAFTRLSQNFPSLASIIQGGATESPMSPEWTPPSFLEDGRHWTEIPKDERTAYARARGWEPWAGKEVGTMQLSDLPTFLERMRGAYLHVRIPGAPDSEVGTRVTAFCLAGALTALWAEERWHSGKPLGFLPIEWFFGGPGSGKGTATKIMSMLVSGDPKTHGSQRFDGQQGGWLTESVLHGPICFRDELDQYLTEVELEDMKAYTSGEPLQLRKKFGTDMTIAPRPVVFSSNALKVNQDDEATKERIVLVQLDPNPLFSKADRNVAFDRFFRWVENDGGLETIHRVCVGLYRQFRLIPLGQPRWTRSASFDSAMAFVGTVLGIDASSIMALAQEMKEDAIQKGARWHRNMRDYLTHEIAGGQMILGANFEALASEVWGIQVADESQVRKFRNWLDEFREATKSGPLRLAGFEIKPGPKTKSTKQMIEFEYTGVKEGVA